MRATTKSVFVFLLTLTLVSATNRYASEVTVSFEREVAQWRVDNLQNAYVVLDDNSIVKVDKAGNKRATVNFKSYGKLTYLDATNPFMLYLFYRNQNVLLITDNFLNHRSSIQLSQIQSDFITVLARSIDDGIWIFDLNDYQLKKYNQNLDLQQTSGNVMNWLNDEPDFNFLVAEGNYVYLNSPKNGILVFDQFANYYKTIPITGLSDFQVVKSQIIYRQDSLFLRYNSKFLSTDTLVQNLKPTESVQAQNTRLFKLEEKSLKIIDSED